MDRIKPLTSVTFAGIVVVLLSVIMYRCDRVKTKEITSETLKDHEETAVIIDPSSRRVTKLVRVDRSKGAPDTRGVSNPHVNIETIDGAREVRVSVGRDGKVTVTARTKGISLHPGFGLLYGNGGTRFSLDVEGYFYKRHSLFAGLNVPVNDAKRVKGHLAYGYTLPYKRFSNTTLVLGFDSDKRVVGGIRVRF